MNLSGTDKIGQQGDMRSRPGVGLGSLITIGNILRQGQSVSQAVQAEYSFRSGAAELSLSGRRPEEAESKLSSLRVEFCHLSPAREDCW